MLRGEEAVEQFMQGGIRERMMTDSFAWFCWMYVQVCAC